MSTQIPSASEIIGYNVSPYLMRRLRTYEEALADIEAKKSGARVVMALIPAVRSTDDDKPASQAAA